MKTIVFATGNKDKLREIGEILQGLDVKVIPMSDTGFDKEIDESGNWVEEISVDDIDLLDSEED